MTPVEVKRGDSPLVLGLPHTGTHVPMTIFSTISMPKARLLRDTDWHIDRLYDGLLRARPRSGPTSTAT
jgi:N-formylglutamate deformylase